MRNINRKKLFRNTGAAMVSLLLFFYATGTAQAATGINEQINFQGKVVNTDGTNVATASYTFLFCIYTTASPTTACTGAADNDAIWRESKSLTVTDGIFQTNLGDTTTLPGSVDFNTDNIYLGINFNANGQVTPLVRFTAAPYALNAAKVGGLTVTDTTGTLTIPGGKTISFADAFTTSGAFATTLTSTGTTNVTLPTTGTLATLAGSETLTDKTIGSTGLTFSGATTDITTGTNEDLTITANGTGIISLNDSITASGSITANGGVSMGTQALTGTTGIIDYTGFDVDASGNLDALGTITAGSGNIAVTDATGNVLHDALVACADTEILKYATAGAWGCATDLSGGSSDFQTTYNNDADGTNVTISLTAADDGFIITNPTSGGNDLSAFTVQVSQLNTTAAITTLDLVQASNAANAVDITANAIDTETGLSITTNGLTSGKGLQVTSSSTVFTGSLAGISLTGSDAANTGNVLAVSNTGTLNTNVTFFVDHRATGTNNLAVRVDDVASDSTPFVIDGAGFVGVGTTAPAVVMDIFQAASAPQLRLSKDLTYYSEFTVDSVGDLLIAAVGSDIRALDENLWVCSDDGCPALTLTGDGNIFVENVLKFGNGVYIKNDSASELTVYDNDDQAMLTFDEL